jgi:hypothetical protein
MAVDPATPETVSTVFDIVNACDFLVEVLGLVCVRLWLPGRVTIESLVIGVSCLLVKMHIVGIIEVS